MIPKSSLSARRASVRELAVTAIMSALSAVLMYLEFSVPFVPDFLKYDFSDLPALLTAFGVSPWAGVTVELLKNVLHLPVTQTGGVGELANFLLGAAFVLPAGLFYRIRGGKSGALCGAVIGTLLSAALSLPVNYRITYPVYTKFLPMEAILGLYQTLNPAATTLWRALLMFNLPFTVVKGTINVLITFLVYKKLSPLLHGRTSGRRRSDKSQKKGSPDSQL